MKSTIEIKVRGYHMDHFNHVNNTRYLEFLEEGVWAYLENNNLVDDLFHKKGIFYTVVNININYRRGAVVGDILRIETEVKKTGRCKIIMSQKIFLKDSDTLIADAEVIYVFIDMKTGKVISVDNEIISLWHDLSKTFGGYSKPRWNRVLCVIYPTAGIL